MVLWSQCPCLQTRVDSFVFFQVSRKTKLYETGRCFAEFRSFRGTEKIRKYEKRVPSCFAKLRNCETMFRSYFRTFSFKFCTYSSSFVPFNLLI